MLGMRANKIAEWHPEMRGFSGLSVGDEGEQTHPLRQAQGDHGCPVQGLLALLGCSGKFKPTGISRDVVAEELSALPGQVDFPPQARSALKAINAMTPGRRRTAAEFLVNGGSDLNARFAPLTALLYSGCCPRCLLLSLTLQSLPTWQGVHCVP